MRKLCITLMAVSLVILSATSAFAYNGTIWPDSTTTNRAR
jgi:hypothetical protein